MSDRTVRIAFEKVLTAFCKNHSPVIPVALENTSFDTKNVKLYLQAILMPAKTIYLSHDARRKYSGMYQMNLVYSENGGAKVVEMIQEELEDLFVMGELENKVMVSAPLASAPSFSDTTNYVKPLWSTYTLIK